MAFNEFEKIEMSHLLGKERDMLLSSVISKTFSMGMNKVLSLFYSALTEKLQTLFEDVDVYSQTRVPFFRGGAKK